jgi:hypothetical protein
MKILAPLLYASVQRPSAWSFMVIRVKIERKDIIRCALGFFSISSAVSDVENS